ncbi:MFS transporter [Marinactinospora endophytica]
MLWTGSTVSQILGMTSPIAFPLIAADLLSASVPQIAAITAFSYLPWLVLTLPLGVYLGKVPPRTVLLTADLVRVVVISFVPLAYVLGVLALWQIYVVVALVGACTVCYEIAYQTFPPALLPREDLTRANARLQGGRAVAYTMGPALGGLLVTVLGAPLTPIANAAGFLVSACCVAAMRTRAAPPGQEGGGTLLRRLGEGLRFVVTRPLLRASTLASAVGNCWFAGYEALVVVFLSREVGLPTGQVGVLVGVAGLGSLVGAGVAGRITRRLGTARALWLPIALVSPFGLLLPATQPGAGVLLFVAGALVFCAGFAMFTVGHATLVQIHTPPALLSRTVASTRFFTRSMLFVGGVLGGLLGGMLGTRGALLVIMAGWMLTPLLLAFSPIRRLRDIPAYDEH